jgi:hypothetical protein
VARRFPKPDVEDVWVVSGNVVPPLAGGIQFCAVGPSVAGGIQFCAVGPSVAGGIQFCAVGPSVAGGIQFCAVGPSVAGGIQFCAVGPLVAGGIQFCADVAEVSGGLAAVFCGSAGSALGKYCPNVPSPVGEICRLDGRLEICAKGRAPCICARTDIEISEVTVTMIVGGMVISKSRARQAIRVLNRSAKPAPCRWQSSVMHPVPRWRPL